MSGALHMTYVGGKITCFEYNYNVIYLFLVTQQILSEI